MASRSNQIQHDSTTVGENATNSGRLAYYHPELLNMHDVFQVMKSHILLNGAFLVRNSFTKPGVLTISVIHNQGIRHFNINMKAGSFCVQSRRFHSLHELVLFYEHHEVPNIEGVHNVFLKYPIAYNNNVAAAASFTGDASNSNVSEYVPMTERGRLRSGSAGSPRIGVLGSFVNGQSDSFASDSSFIRQTSQHSLIDSLSEDLLTERRKTVREKLRGFIGRSKANKFESGRKLKLGSSLDNLSSCSNLQRRLPLMDGNSVIRLTSANFPRQSVNNSSPTGMAPQSQSAASIVQSNSTEEVQGQMPVLSTASLNAAVSPINFAELSQQTDRQQTQTAAANILSRETDNLPAETQSSTALQTVSSEHPYYSNPRDVERETVDDLIEILRRQENEEYEVGGDKCVCGLTLDESELPRGWSVHISTESTTEGRLFFTGPDGTTSWNLPLEVCVDLDPDQQDRLRDLLISQRAGRRQLSRQLPAELSIQRPTSAPNM